ncbi:cell division protein DedD [Lonsdalea britannica]|uniref:Cell division protein DedD n=1 Tax=Lonsdalea britannica TaxID=1082704 RepID=A0AAD0SIQ4_9GAMM|nr:cell division protein DedD [Lonsdalea britannica]AXW88484.1 SPOR domain-containing protein [Lonsdalea britannica]OSN00575.1 cell division protein DedD [Lonsdalea britannica]
MASKFQNRLVGTVILVALGVIVLPGLLDGKKKHYQDEFAAIPLVPKPEDTLEAESLPPITQSLTAQSPDSTTMPDADDSGEEMESADRAANSAPDTVAPQNAAPPAATRPSAPSATPVIPPPVKSEPKPKPEVKPEAKPKPEVKPVPKPVENKPAAAPQAPAGQAFVVQLGALKNADKVNEIVAKLRLSGFRAYTVPSSPVSGQITRIYVGPDASKQKLQSSLGELQQISGLSGQVKAAH